MANSNMTNAPARGDSKVIPHSDPDAVVKVNEVAQVGESAQPFAGRGNSMGATPGTVNEESRRKSLVLAGLGDVSGDEEEIEVGKVAEDKDGEGDRIVVISDYLSGPNGVGFVKGNVRYMSLLFDHWGKEKYLPVIRRAAKRLFELEAIRLATDTEARMSQVAVTAASETSDVQKERDARIRAERELENLRTQLLAAHEAQAAASPQPLGSSGEQVGKDGMPDF